jgi:hypothetical protein
MEEKIHWVTCLSIKFKRIGTGLLGVWWKSECMWKTPYIRMYSSYREDNGSYTHRSLSLSARDLTPTDLFSRSLLPPCDLPTIRLMIRFTLCIMVGKAHSLGILSRVKLDSATGLSQGLPPFVFWKLPPPLIELCNRLYWGCHLQTTSSAGIHQEGRLKCGEY